MHLTGFYQLPFGKRRTFFNNNGMLAKVVGGMQFANTFEWQAGPLLDWGNIYYYGDINDIALSNPAMDEYFNTRGTACNATPGPATGFELCANRNPDTYHTRQFPSRIPGLRKPHTLQVNSNVQKEIPLPLRKEQVKLILRFDMLNVFNRYLFDGPNTTPSNTNFGTITTQLAAVNRFLQFQARIQF
jgi:hypothetical protein